MAQEAKMFLTLLTNNEHLYDLLTWLTMDLCRVRGVLPADNAW